MGLVLSTILKRSSLSCQGINYKMKKMFQPNNNYSALLGVGCLGEGTVNLFKMIHVVMVVIRYYYGLNKLVLSSVAISSLSKDLFCHFLSV
jgi:hypothetical protein